MTEAVIAPMDWFLYDNGLRHEKVKKISEKSLNCSNGINDTFHWYNFINAFWLIFHPGRILQIKSIATYSIQFINL